MALGISASSPDTQRCQKLGGTGSGTVWFCRGSGSSYPTVADVVDTDSTGAKWYLVTNTNGNANCVTNATAFGSGYSSSVGACSGSSGGFTYSIATQNYTEVVTNSKVTVTDNTTATSSAIQTINGVVYPANVTTTPNVA